MSPGATPVAPPPAPEDGELLALLDGELTAERQAEIRRLLETDWSLRVRLAELERDIETYVAATKHPLSGEAPPFDAVWQGVSARLAREAAPAVRFEILTTPRRERALRLAAASVVLWLVVGAVVFYLPRWNSLGAVSAHELLRRSAQAEAARLEQVTEPVVYRRVQVRRVIAGRAETAAWESWQTGRDFRRRVAGRVEEKTATPILAELEQVLRANQLDVQRPLSATAYAEWRKTIRPKSESVTDTTLPGNDAGLKLTTVVGTPAAPGRIVEASFIVRRADWHAVALHLNVQGENELRGYELSETAYEVLPMQALAIYADATPPPVPAATLPPASASSTPLEALPSEAVLQEAEIAARYALHRLQADLGEQIEISRDAAGYVVVRGLVETAGRKQELLDALRGAPHTKSEIQTIEEASRARQPIAPAQAPQPYTARPADPAPHKDSRQSIFRQQLARYFSGQLGAAGAETAHARAAALADRAVSLAEAAMNDAWALRRLAERYRTDDGLKAEDRRRLAAMARSHAERLRGRVRTLRGLIEPPLDYAVKPGAPPTDEPDAVEAWQAQSLAAFAGTDRINQSIRALFAGSPLPGGISEEQVARSLLSLLPRFERSLNHLEQSLTWE